MRTTTTTTTITTTSQWLPCPRFERRVADNGDLSWWWTPQAEAALGLSEVLASADERVN